MKILDYVATDLRSARPRVQAVVAAVMGAAFVFVLAVLPMTILAFLDLASGHAEASVLLPIGILAAATAGAAAGGMVFGLLRPLSGWLGGLGTWLRWTAGMIVYFTFVFATAVLLDADLDAAFASRREWGLWIISAGALGTAPWVWVFWFDSQPDSDAPRERR